MILTNPNTLKLSITPELSEHFQAMATSLRTLPTAEQLQKKVQDDKAQTVN
jgi:hypothetical protein